MKTQLKSIKTVSEYIALGGLAAGFLLESPVKETAKALAFPAVQINRNGNPCNGVAWLPKSQLVAVKNDYYTSDAPPVMFLCPQWLYERNFRWGETI